MWVSELYRWAMFQGSSGGVSNMPVDTCPVVEQDPMKNEYGTEKGYICFTGIFKKLYPWQTRSQFRL